ncbi:MAG TPA: DUF87 domain-containing protein [bacterium]|nr:DUF87 domain-containing protein [bacterium]
MERIVTNSTNFDALKKAVNEAEREILICSAWIRSEMINRIFDDTAKRRIHKKNIRLRFILRIGEMTDVEITDAGVFAFFEEMGGHVEVRYHRTLHAKMYVVDDCFAMLGSFNLTGGGFGDEHKPGKNPETGFLFDEAAKVAEVRKRFEEIWTDSSTMTPGLLGFVLNPADDGIFHIAGIADLPVNRFVEVRLNDGSRMLGQIEKSQKYSPDFFSLPPEDAEKDAMNELFQTFISTSPLHIQAKALTIRDAGQLRIGLVKILSLIVPCEGGSFKRIRNTTPPDIAAEVYNADPVLLEQFYGNADCAPAVMIENQDIRVGLDPVELATKHMAIFGSTGSGKSYFAKHLLSCSLVKWFCEKRKGRIVIFDPHGEYSRDLVKPPFNLPAARFEILQSDGKRRLEARIIESVDDLIEICELEKPKKEEREFLASAVRVGLAAKSTESFMQHLREKAGNATESDLDMGQLDFLRALIEENIAAFLDPFDKLAKKEVEELIAQGKVDKKEKDAEIRNRVNAMFARLDEPMRKQIIDQIVKKNLHTEFEKFIETKSRLLSEDLFSRIETAVQSGKIQFGEFDPAATLTDNKIYCVDFSAIHDKDARFELTANIIREIFNNKKTKGTAERDTIFVVEEAHNFAPEGEGKNNPAAEMIKKIATEGRKFNLGLMVITQRPAQVSKAVLSQCSTQAIFRLINPTDIKAIGEIVEGIGESELHRLPNYEQGEALFTGVAVKKPVVVKVI